MISRVLRVLFVIVVAIWAVPAIGLAQEATVSGTVTDSTGGVLPGVTITATHVASGNTFVAVTDERGGYRLPVRTGGYQLTAELQGFTTATRTGLELLVGQQAVLNLQVAPSSVQETVTVTAEAPLVNTASSALGGNIDTRQMQELPVNGRNWLDLSMLAPGARANAVGVMPVARDHVNSTGTFQLNIDGQQVTGNCCGSTGGQPRFSRDAIAEFQFVANRFDAVQGRSSGMQVNVITKSGTNTASGSLSGYFRDATLNAADFIQDRVLPYSNQQLSATLGGPIIKDKLHFFANYEYEREPQTITFDSPFPRFNAIDQGGVRKEHKAGARVDFQLSTQTRLMLRGSTWSHELPIDVQTFGAGGASLHPSSSAETNFGSNQLYATLTKVFGNQTLNETKVGYAGQMWDSFGKVRWSGATRTFGKGAPHILLRGYSIGPQARTAQRIGQDVYSVRNDFTTSFSKGGRHDLRTGGEYLYQWLWLWWCNFCNGQIDATLGPIPADIEELFPVWDDVSTWNLAALSPITRRYRYSVGDYNILTPRHMSGFWAQDDWAVTDRLTLNLGVRYDVDLGALANDVGLPPFLEANRPDDLNNVSPRLGFAYSLTDRTVIRGGWGKYFAQIVNQPAHLTKTSVQQIYPEILNDGRPDFAANPLNGPMPAFDDVLVTLCPTNPGPNCVRREASSTLVSPTAQIPYSYQGSIGAQRQLGDMMSVQADYVFNGVRHDRFTRNMNLAYNPATGANYPFSDISHRPYPDWGVVNMDIMDAWSNSHSLETAFTKRFSGRWQASGTYTLSGYWDGTTAPATGFPVAPDLGGEYSLGVTDQRHRAVFNGIWDAGYGFQVSGLYFFGSGYRFATNYGGDLRDSGASSEGRLRPDGSVVPRNAFVGRPVHRVDARVQRRIGLGGRAALDGILEVFNVFNHANYGSYVTSESNVNYGKPSFNNNVAYQPRMVQLGFRLAF